MLNHGILVLGQLIWLAGILAGSLGVGRMLLARLKLTGLTAAAEIALGMGMGLALLSYAVFTLAAGHWLCVWSLGALSGLWMAGATLLWFSPPLNLAVSEKSVFKSPVAKVLAGLLLLQAFFNLVGALTPAWDWDGVAYHLALPKIYLAAGGFVFRPDIYHNLFPQFTEMLYTLGLLFPWGSAPKLVHFSFGLLAAAAVYALGREQNWKFSALLAAAVFYMQSLVHWESGTAFIDLAGAAYLGLAALAFGQTFKPRAQPGWFYLAALLAGLVAATKWHGLALSALAMCLLWIKIKQQDSVPRAQKIRQGALVALWGALPALPYLCRAWLFSGNPVWPLGYSLFHGATWDAGMDKAMGALVANFAGTSHGWLGWARLPYDLVVHGNAFGLGGQELRWPLVGLVVLVLAALVFWRAEGKTEPANPHLFNYWPGIFTGAGLIYTAIWFESSPQMRFLLPLFGLCAWGAAYGLRRLWFLPGHAPKLAAAAAGVLLFCVHPPLHGDTLLQMKTVAGLVSPEAFLAQKLDHYPACQFINQQTPRGGRVLLFRENRGFYLDADYLWGDPQNQMLLDYRNLHSPAELAARLKSLGVAWVLYRNDSIFTGDYYSPEVVRLMNGFLAQQAQRAYASPAADVYRIRD